MISTPLSIVTNTLGDSVHTDLNIRPREGMPTLLCDQDRIIGTVKDSRYENLLCEAGRLREQLSAATFILDNIPGISIDTLQMRRVLEDSKVEGE